MRQLNVKFAAANEGRSVEFMLFEKTSGVKRQDIFDSPPLPSALFWRRPST